MGLSFDWRSNREPVIDLSLEGINGACVPVEDPMNRQALVFFPSLDGSYLAPQKDGNLFPRVESVGCAFREAKQGQLSLKNRHLIYLPHSGALMRKFVRRCPLESLNGSQVLSIGGNSQMSKCLREFGPYRLTSSSPCCASFKTCGGGSDELSASKN